MKDKKLFGRPMYTATTDDNISKIQVFIKSDQYCTYDVIEAEFQISRETIHTIIYYILFFFKFVFYFYFFIFDSLL